MGMVTLFASRRAGGSDDDDVILASFECFENEGKIDAESFRHSLMTFGVKFSASEVDDAFAEMKIDEGMIDAAHLKGLISEVNWFFDREVQNPPSRSMTTHIYWAPLLGSHSFCEKSSSPSFIKDSTLGTMQKYESHKKKSGTTNQTNSIQETNSSLLRYCSKTSSNAYLEIELF